MNKPRVHLSCTFVSEVHFTLSTKGDILTITILHFAGFIQNSSIIYNYTKQQ